MFFGSYSLLRAHSRGRYILSFKPRMKPIKSSIVICLEKHHTMTATDITYIVHCRRGWMLCVHRLTDVCSFGAYGCIPCCLEIKIVLQQVSANWTDGCLRAINTPPSRTLRRTIGPGTLRYGTPIDTLPISNVCRNPLRSKLKSTAVIATVPPPKH
jgi:hypothetical protein